MESTATSSAAAPEHCPPGYSVHWSRSKKMFYFFNAIDGDKVWACDYDHARASFKVVRCLKFHLS